MKVAIIDDGIDIETLNSCTNQTEHYIVKNDNILPCLPLQEPTHGGLCAEIFSEVTGRLPDVSICLPRDGAYKGNINDLLTALNWCVKNGVDLINLSMGTTRFFDYAVLQSAVNILNNAGIILVAGANNRGMITYPAVFNLCISVCCDYELKNNEVVYIEKPFDGIDIATYSVISKRANIIGTNSLSTAYISGIICKEFDSKIDVDKVRQFFIEKSIKIDADWKYGYLKRKVSNALKYDSIIVACFAKSFVFMNDLKNYINNDEYTCAIISKSVINRPWYYEFSLDASPMTSAETLDFISKSCRPSVILTDSEELSDYSDITAHDGINTHDLWDKIKAIYKE